MQFCQRLGKIPRQKVKNFSSMSGNDGKHKTFTQLSSSFKYLYGHVRCSFVNPEENFSTGGRKFFAQCPRMTEKTESLQKTKKYSSSKYSKRPVGWSFVNSLINLSTKCQKFISQRPKILGNK